MSALNLNDSLIDSCVPIPIFITRRLERDIQTHFDNNFSVSLPEKWVDCHAFKKAHVRCSLVIIQLDQSPFALNMKLMMKECLVLDLKKSPG